MFHCDKLQCAYDTISCVISVMTYRMVRDKMMREVDMPERSVERAMEQIRSTHSTHFQSKLFQKGNKNFFISELF